MAPKVVRGRILAAMSVVVLTAGGLAVTAGAAPGDDPVASRVTITEVPVPPSAPCVLEPLARLALTPGVIDTATSFSLVVQVGAPLCSPIQAKAAVYRMPNNGSAWPQTLVEVVPFELQAQGTVTITFEKRCENVQFDVIEGDTPETIAPEGPWHGPLLFALDTSTTLQSFGLTSAPCLEPTPFGEPPSSSSTTSTTTTTSTSVPPSGQVGGLGVTVTPVVSTTGTSPAVAATVVDPGASAATVTAAPVASLKFAG